MLAVIGIFLASVAFSYARAMMAPSSLPLSIRSIEWVRDYGGAGLVNLAERVYYSATAPKSGGPGLQSLPQVGASIAASGPAEVVGAVRPPLPGEGVWRDAARKVLGGVPVRVTVFRPEAAYPRQLAYAAWIDTSRVRLELYPGRVQPPDANPRGPMQVPGSLHSQLVATFNSGFTYKDSQGGFALQGRTIEPMRAGQGTVVEYTDGSIDVRSWGASPSVGPNVVLARQNLPLIVDNAQPNPRLGDRSLWGATLGNKIRVWRSALGIDTRGNLIYIAAPGQTAASLADAIIRAGATRAMELDINAFWPSFNTYAGGGSSGAAKFVPNPNHASQRYLAPDDRDFFAVYAAPALKVLARK